MGEYTKNNFFYKPHLGARGEDEKNKFDAALDYTDTELADLRDKKHDRVHAINSPGDHTSVITPGSLIKADNNGLPAEASTNDVLNIIGASSSPQANQIPILNSSGQLSLPFVQPPILVSGQDLMSRVFYVDVVNGSDSNSGTSSAPFATIKKAIGSIPNGGKGKIYIVANSDVVIQESNIFVYNKYIEVRKSGSGIVTIKKSNPTASDFEVINSVLEFNNINFLGLPKDASTTYDYNWVAHFRLWASTVAVFYSNIALDNGSFVITIDGSGFACLYIRSCSITTTSDTVAVLKLFYDTAAYVFRGGSTIDDTTKHVSGIIKDTNGIPRNVISDIVL